MNRRSTAGIAAAVIILVVLPFITFLFLKKGSELRSKRRVPHFTLTSAGGSLFDSRGLDSMTYVAEFTFAQCRSIVCHKLDSIMRALDDRFGGSPDFRMVTVTIDAKRDSAGAMHALAQQRDAAQHWYFLTGQQDTIEHLILGGFFAKPDFGRGNPARMRADREILLVDKRGIIKGYYNVLDADETKKLFDAVETLLYGN